MHGSVSAVTLYNTSAVRVIYGVVTSRFPAPSSGNSLGMRKINWVSSSFNGLTLR